jgi:hypothetical protein
MVLSYEFIFFTVFCIAEPHHFYVAPAPGENFDVAPALAVPVAPAALAAPALDPTLLYLKQVKKC